MWRWEGLGRRRLPFLRPSLLRLGGFGRWLMEVVEDEASWFVLGGLGRIVRGSGGIRCLPWKKLATDQD